MWYVSGWATNTNLLELFEGSFGMGGGIYLAFYIPSVDIGEIVNGRN